MRLPSTDHAMPLETVRSLSMTTRDPSTSTRTSISDDELPSTHRPDQKPPSRINRAVVQAPPI